jgi:hypothetical protein
MAITEMSPRDQYAVTSLFKGFQNKQWIDSARTHDPHGPDVGRILQPGYTGQVGAGIGTPVTQKSNYFWFKFIHYATSLSIITPVSVPFICIKIISPGSLDDSITYPLTPLHKSMPRFADPGNEACRWPAVDKKKHTARTLYRRPKYSLPDTLFLRFLRAVWR